MATQPVGTAPDVVDEEKSMLDVVDAELGKVIYEEEVETRVLALETKIGDWGPTKDAKGGPVNVNMQGTHMVETCIEYPYLVSHDIFEDEANTILGRECRKDAMEDTKFPEVVTTSCGELVAISQASLEGEFVKEDTSSLNQFGPKTYLEATVGELRKVSVEFGCEHAMDPSVLADDEYTKEDTPFVPPHATEIDLDPTHGELEDMGATLKEKDSDLETSNERNATKMDFCSTTSTTLDGEFTEDVLENILVEPSNKNAYLDSLDVLKEAEIVLAQEEDAKEMNYEEVVLATEGKLDEYSRKTHGSKFIIDTPLVLLDTTKAVEATISRLEEIGATIVQDDSQEVRGRTQDGLITVEDKSVKERTLLSILDVPKSEAMLNLCEVLEQDAQAPIEAKMMMSTEQHLVKDLHTTSGGDQFDRDVSTMLGRDEEKYIVIDPKCAELVFKDDNEFSIKSQASTELEDSIATLEAKQSELIVAVNDELDQLDETNATLTKLCSNATTIIKGESSQYGLEKSVAKSRKKDACLDSVDVLDEAKTIGAQKDKNHGTREENCPDSILIEKDKLENELQTALESLLVKEDSSMVSLDATKDEQETKLGGLENTSAPIEQHSSQATYLILKDIVEDALTIVRAKSIKEGTSLGTPHVLESDMKLSSHVVIEKDAPQVEDKLIKDWQSVHKGNDIKVQIEDGEQKMVQGVLGTNYTYLASSDTLEDEGNDALVKEDSTDVTLYGKDMEVMTTTSLSLANFEETPIVGQFSKGSLVAPLDMLEGDIDSTFRVVVKKDSSTEEMDGEKLTNYGEFTKEEKAAEEDELGMVSISLSSFQLFGGEISASFDQEDKEANASMNIEVAPEEDLELTKDGLQIRIDQKVVNRAGNDEMFCKQISAESKDAVEGIYSRFTKNEVANATTEGESIYELGDNQEARDDMVIKDSFSIEQSSWETKIGDKFDKSERRTDQILHVSGTIQSTFVYGGGGTTEDAKSSSGPGHMEKMPSVGVDVVDDAITDSHSEIIICGTLNDDVDENPRDIESSYADVCDGGLDYKLDLAQATDGDTKAEENVVGEVVELDKEQTLCFDVTMEGNTTNDEIDAIISVGEIYDRGSKTDDEDVSVRSDKNPTQVVISFDVPEHVIKDCEEQETTLGEVANTSAPIELESSQGTYLVARDIVEDALTIVGAKSIKEGTSLATPHEPESDMKLPSHVVVEKDAPQVEDELIKDWQSVHQENDIKVRIEDGEQKMIQGVLGTNYTYLASCDTSEDEGNDALVKEDNTDVSLYGKDMEVVKTTSLSLANVEKTIILGQFSRGSLVGPLDMLEGDIDSTFRTVVQTDASTEEKDGEKLTNYWELTKEEKAAQEEELGTVSISLSSFPLFGGEMNASFDREDKKGNASMDIEVVPEADLELTKDGLKIHIDEEVINRVGDNEMFCRRIFAGSKDAFEGIYPRSTNNEVAKATTEAESIYELGDNKDARDDMVIKDSLLIEQSSWETKIEDKFDKSETTTDQILMVSGTIQPSFVYGGGDITEHAKNSSGPGHMEKVPSVGVDVVDDVITDSQSEIIICGTLNDECGENPRDVESSYADVSGDALDYELDPALSIDGDTKAEENVVGEIVELDKEQTLRCDVIMEGNNTNDEIDAITSDDEIYDGDSKTDDKDVSVRSDKNPSRNVELDKMYVYTTVASEDTSGMFSVEEASVGMSASSSRSVAPLPPSRSSISSPTELEATSDPIKVMSNNEKKLHEKLEMIIVKFMRLVCKMGVTPEEPVAAQVLDCMSLAKSIHHGHTNQSFNLENAWNKALQQEYESQEDLCFSCNILVLGKTGVGKSAAINSIFGEEKSKIDAFDAATTNVRHISGNVDGIQVHIIDTPGLRTNVMDQGWNRKILSAVKSYTKKCPPDIILYVDRLDCWSHDLDDLPLLRTITATLGTSIWLNTIVALTHAASTPADSSNGDPMTYETLIAQRSHIIQQAIRHAASDMCLMNPVALVENNPYCERNCHGQKVLPNGQTWRNQLMLWCYSTKTLSEANSILKLQDPSSGEHSCIHFHPVQLPFLLSSLLQPRSHLKLSADQGGDGYSDICDDEDEYDHLSHFRPLTKAQVDKLTKDQKNAYLDEHDYRVNLLQKKQRQAGLQRLKETKKRGKSENYSNGYGYVTGENGDDPRPENVAVPLPDIVLPPSFDSDDPTYLYRFLEPTSTVIARPVLDVPGWDHDRGFDGVSLEDDLAITGKFPAVVSVQLTKDKREFTIHLNSSISGKHGENASSLAGFDVQTVRRQLACVLRSEAKKIMKKNNTSGGFAETFLGDNMATGVKVEDQLSIRKGMSLVASTGAMRAQGDTVYGASLEACLKDKDYPIKKFMMFLGLSLMKWHGDLALGANMQSQFSVGRGSKMALHIGLNNKMNGKINVKMSTSEQVQMALLGLVPLAASIYKSFCPAQA